MEKLRAHWTKEMLRLDIEGKQASASDRTLEAFECETKSAVYQEVIRDTEWFNEEFSKLLAEVTEAHQNVKRIHQREPNTATLASLKYLERTKDKLERLNQGKEVRT